MLTPKDAILLKIVLNCAKECLILKYKYIQNPWDCHELSENNYVPLYLSNFHNKELLR